mmetsp:Transcript_20209/g.17397  ORF Transcript_20209/g.17397 Transcript_20209/m.17397 type:complete len:121 (+) Transcript_20209:709-1071(+)
MPKETIKKRLQELILKEGQKQSKVEYIIAISALCKLIQRNDKDPKAVNDPQFDVNLNLAPINIQLKKPQLEDVIRILEFMNDYTRFKLKCQKQKKEEMGKLNDSELDQMKQEFKSFFRKV